MSRGPPLLHGQCGVLLAPRVVARKVAEQDVLSGREVDGELGAPTSTRDPVICIAGLLVRGNDRGRCVGGRADDVLLDKDRYVLVNVDRKVARRDIAGIGLDDELMGELTRVGDCERHRAGFHCRLFRSDVIHQT